MQHGRRCRVEAADTIIISHQLPKASRFRLFLGGDKMKTRDAFDVEAGQEAVIANEDG